MALYTAGLTTSAQANGAAYAALLTTANRRAFIRETGYFTTAATLSPVSIGIPANAASVTLTGATTPQAQDTTSEAAATATISGAYGTAPTAPSPFWRKTTLAASIGQGVIFKLAPDERWTVKETFSICWWNHGTAAGSALDLYVMYDE